MPSPIAHSVAAYVISRVAARHVGSMRPFRIGRLPKTPALLLATLGLSLLPDIDSVPAFITGDFARFHNNITHSLFVGLGVALVAGGIAWLVQRSGFRQWFVIALLCYDLHIVMDFFTVGRGVMALWPLTGERFQSPLKLFYGLHWSEGWVSTRNLWTFVTEVAFSLVVLGIAAVTNILRNRAKPQAQVDPVLLPAQVEDHTAREG
jgi:hypothetical protein